MMRLIKLKCFGAILIGALLASCEKGEGQGGTSTIKGTVITEEWNGDFSIKRSEYYAQKEDVFIIYGDDDFYGEETDTNYNGVYEFKYLREGTYTIYVYSKNPLLNYDITNEKMVVKQVVTITKKNQTVTVPEMRIIN